MLNFQSKVISRKINYLELINNKIYKLFVFVIIANIGMLN